MFEKRLFSLVPQATPYIMASVLFKWIALMANITVMWMLALILGGIVTDGLTAALAVDALAQAALPLAAAIIVRAASIYLAQRAGDKAAFEAVRRVRSLVYDKLIALGPSYTETSTPPRPSRPASRAPRNSRCTLAVTCRSSSLPAWHPSRCLYCSWARRVFPPRCCSPAFRSSPSPS